MQELYDASSEARDADAVAAVWMGVYNAPFVTLYDRGLLTHLIVVDEVPEAAQAQLDAMAAEVASSTVEPVEEVVAPVVVQIDPVAQCRIDFHEMGSAQFMQRYLNNQKNRPTYEAAIVPRLAMRVSKLKRKRDRQRKRHEQRPQRVAPSLRSPEKSRPRFKYRRIRIFAVVQRHR
jgi:hypothetical protein